MTTNTETTATTAADTQVAPSHRDEQLERLSDLQQLIDNLLEAAQEVSLSAQEIADEDEEQGDVYDAAQGLIDKVDIVDEVVGVLRYLTAAIKDEWAQPDLFDEGDKGGDKNAEEGAAT